MISSGKAGVRVSQEDGISRMLAVNPGARYLGLAMFEGAQLLDWRVKMIRGRELATRLDYSVKIIETLLAQYQPKILVLKRLHCKRSSPALDTLVERLTELARRRGLPVYRLSIRDAARLLSPNSTMGKRGLVETAIRDYPALYPDLQAARRAVTDLYQLRLLEAVVLGMACRRVLRRY